MTRRWRSPLFVVVTTALAACGPAVTPSEDAGPPVCLGGGDTSVRAGHTGLDFHAIQDGDELPAWTRPQGGIGTRINVLLKGYEEEVRFTGLTTQFLGPPLDVACQDDAGCGALELCDAGVCRLLLGEQTNVRLDINCQEDGTLHIPEMSVRFRNDFELEQLDGSEQELRLTFQPREGEPVSSSVDITLRVGEFVLPSWWDTGARP